MDIFVLLENFREYVYEIYVVPHSTGFEGNFESRQRSGGVFASF